MITRKKLKKKCNLKKKYNVGDCFISFYQDDYLNVYKIKSSNKHYYRCIHVYNCFWNDFGIGTRDLKDTDLDSYIKIESSLYDSIQFFIQKYNLRKSVEYKKLGDKYHKEICDYIENLKQEFK